MPNLADTIYRMDGLPGMATNASNANLASRIARVEHTVPYLIGGGAVAPSSFSPLDSTAVRDGKLNISSSKGISFIGSMAPSVVDGAFAATQADATHLTIYWDGTNSSRVIVIRRANGTTATVPPNNITISGLTASNKYAYYPYWAPSNQCGIGWGVGDTGTPLIAFSSGASATLINQAIAAQHAAGIEVLGALQFTQPASGSGTPSPSAPPSPNPGTCVKLGTEIQPLGNISPSDWSTANYRQQDWIFLQTESGRNVSCTPNHPLFSPDSGKTRADLFKPGAWIITRSGEEKIDEVTSYIRACTKVETKMRHGHLFWANGFLSHNVKPDLQ